MGAHRLVVAQTALALVLLIGSGLLTRSFVELRSVDPGYNTENLFTFQIAPEGAHLTDAATHARFHTDFMDRLRAIAGVESVGLIENLPLNEGTSSARFRPEETGDDETAGAQLAFNQASFGAFKTLQIEIQEGRAFEQSDHVTQLGNAVINQSVAELWWPQQSAIGRRFKGQGDEDWTTVVGVADDILHDSFRQAATPTIYFPIVGPAPSNLCS